MKVAKNRKLALIAYAVIAFASGAAAETLPTAGMYRLEAPGVPPAYPVTVTARFTPEALQLDAVMPHPDLDAVHCTAQSAADKVWEDESVEFFIAPAPGAGEEYLHYTVNADGVIHAARNTVPAPDLAAKATATVSRSRATGCWQLRLCIPWHELGGALAEGDSRRFNILRTVKVGDRTLEISSWSRLDLGAHEPWNFGTVTRNGEALLLQLPTMETWSSAIANGGFESGLDSWEPGTWSGGDMYGDGVFTSAIEAGGVEGLQALRLSGRNVGRPRMEGARMGYSGTPVELEPGRYVLSGYYRGNADGELPIPGQFASVYVNGGNRELFLGEAPGWRRFECVFERKEAGSVRPMIRLWANGAVWFDGLDITPWQPMAAEPVQLSTERTIDGTRYTLVQHDFEAPGEAASRRLNEVGGVLFQRPPEQLQPDSAPADHELCDRLDDNAIPGTRALQFVNLYGNGSWQISQSPDGNLPASWLTLHRIPFWLQRTDYDGRQIRWMAEVLYPLAPGEAVTVTPEQLGVLALQWDVPADARPGRYQTNLLFTETGSNRRLSLPVALEVGDFTLPEAESGLGMWVAPSQMPRVLDYMHSGGVAYASFPLPLQLSCAPGGAITVDADEAVERLRQAAAAGMGFPLPVELTTLSTDLARLLGLYDALPKDATFDSSHLICPPDAASYPAELTAAYEEALRQLHEQLEAAGFADKVLFYPVDEPTSNPHRMFKARHEGGIIKRVLPGARVFMTAHDLVRTEQLAQAGALDAVCLSLGTLRSNPDWARRFYAMAERNHLEVWAYTGSTAENYSRMRLLGWQCAAQQLKRLMLWVSYFDTATTTDEWNDLRAPLKRVATFYPTDDGYRSTIQWEGIRQAALDLRYWQAARELAERLPEAEAAAWRRELEELVKPFAGVDEPPPEAVREVRRRLFQRLNRK